MKLARISGVTGRWILIVMFSMSGNSYSADEQQFGRLFTTREERQRLQEIREENMRTPGGRNIGTATRAMVDRDRAGQTQGGSLPGTEEGKGDLPVITLKGLIYRKGQGTNGLGQCKGGDCCCGFPGTGIRADT